ncbi:hypothetical protein Salmuc_02583 [Salipiger mucosus DSM 16094]|uniref:Uncharacterized protein n=1 Tax=Salipiger mucosus DSM 16094 TaxID=1123237 RepID=S9QEF2_9RHOB|nr:hypothetical protein Salmuc_02583 [Salipiger mucosus DSM 16094]
MCDKLTANGRRRHRVAASHPRARQRLGGKVPGTRAHGAALACDQGIPIRSNP